jgi:hypothetical protein
MYNAWDLEGAMQKANGDPAVPKICYSDVVNKETKELKTTPAAIQERADMRS